MTITPLMNRLVSDAVLDAAFDWLCQRRRDYPDHSDVWALRRNWPDEKDTIRRELQSGEYKFALLARVTLKNSEEVDLWASRDALVLKALTMVLSDALPVSARCTHTKGHGGAKYAVREVRDNLADNRCVFRTDVKSYYASIDHLTLLDQLAVYIRDRRIMNLLGQYLIRTSERGGSFWEHDRGISLGCPLSPLIGAFYLNALDAALERTGLFYIRFMDDILVLAPNRWQLRRAVRLVNQTLASLHLEKHPDKTFIGLIVRGFDFLGYHFQPQSDLSPLLTIARQTFAGFIEKASQLYEQKRGKPDRANALEMYVRRWKQWATAGLGGSSVGLIGDYHNRLSGHTAPGVIAGPPMVACHV